MMSRGEILQRIEAGGLVAVVRAENPGQAVDTCRALARGGITSWEIAMTTPGALHAIEHVADELGDQGILGVGTVLDCATAASAIHAGAQFIFAPIVDSKVIEAAHRYDKVMVPGALTPTEIATAWSAGADLVKLFPANHFGPQYIRDIHGPFPYIRLTPTGGVSLETATAWLDAGATCLGVGSSLVKKDWLRAGNWDAMTELAQQYVETVRNWKQQQG